LFTPDVDGEWFAIRRAGGGDTVYDWVSEPNRGYGFGSSRTHDHPMVEHRESIRAFLAMIDPSTGSAPVVARACSRVVRAPGHVLVAAAGLPTEIIPA
jgi:hypothetical protein